MAFWFRGFGVLGFWGFVVSWFRGFVVSWFRGFAIRADSRAMDLVD